MNSKQNLYYGKSFSILGDSISTLAGYNPEGYAVFYQGENCVLSDIRGMYDTWWGKVISFFEGQLVVNNSWSGSRVTKIKNKMEIFPSGCSGERTALLHKDNVHPDFILIYMGFNDWARGVNVQNEKAMRGECVLENFEGAYDCMLKRIKRNYPNSEICCFSLCRSCISATPQFTFPYAYAGIHIEAYNHMIEKVAQRNQCAFLDIYKYRIPYDSIDGSHPTKNGMNTMADLMISAMQEKGIKQHREQKYSKKKGAFTIMGILWCVMSIVLSNFSCIEYTYFNGWTMEVQQSIGNFYSSCILCVGLIEMLSLLLKGLFIRIISIFLAGIKLSLPWMLFYLEIKFGAISNDYMSSLVIYNGIPYILLVVCLLSLVNNIIMAIVLLRENG